VFDGAHPGEVGLKEVARAAGVSHALITHYFGTYAGLIEATLERKILVLRAEILLKLREPGALARPEELLGMVFRALHDPVHLRLVMWMLATERAASANAFALQHRGLRVVAEEVARAMPVACSVERVELALVTAVAAAYGYAISKHALAGAIGQAPSAELDTEIQRTLGAMVRTYLRS
jgi:AcrR family transcriptional regulator